MRQEEGPDGAPRFRRLETIREYARELLAASGEEETLRRRHAMYYTEQAEHVYAQGYGSEAGAWYDRLAPDYDNLRAALSWSVAASEHASIALRLTSALHLFWLNRGPANEGLRWIERALALPWGTELREARAAALNAAGRQAIDVDKLDMAEQFLTESLALYEQLEDLRSRSEVLALALTGLATALALESGGNSLCAARLWGASAEAYASRCMIPFGPSFLSVPGLDQALVQRAQDTVRAVVGDAAFEAAWAAGRALTLEQAVEEAMEFTA